MHEEVGESSGRPARLHTLSTVRASPKTTPLCRAFLFLGFCSRDTCETGKSDTRKLLTFTVDPSPATPPTHRNVLDTQTVSTIVTTSHPTSTYPIREGGIRITPLTRFYNNPRNHPVPCWAKKQSAAHVFCESCGFQRCTDAYAPSSRRVNPFDTTGAFSHPSSSAHGVLPVTIVTHRSTFTVFHRPLRIAS